MPIYTRSPNIGGMLPEQWSGDLLREPLTRAALAFDPAVSTTATPNVTMHFPRLTDDVTSSWIEEGAEISPSDAAFAEVAVTPTKCAALSIVSREMADDSSPDSASVIGQSIANSLAQTIDAAFFGALAAPAPPGLAALDGVSEVQGAAQRTSFDDFNAAVSGAEQVGASLTSWVCHPDTALALSVIKEGSHSVRPLMGADPTTPTRSVILGRPVLTSTAIPADDGLVWGLDASRNRTVLREDIVVEQSRDVLFTSDRIALRGIARVAFGFLHPAAVVRLTTAAS